MLCTVLYLFAVLYPNRVEATGRVEDEVAHDGRRHHEEGDGDEEDGVVAHPGAVLPAHLDGHGERNALPQQLHHLHSTDVSDHHGHHVTGAWEQHHHGNMRVIRTDKKN